MPRLPPLDENKLAPNQRKIYDEIKRVRGPFAVWLRNAELAEHALGLQDLFASRAQLDRRLIQLIILVSARHTSAQFAWHVHAPHALKEGIAPDIVDAIRERRTPTFAREDERLVYDIAMELNTTHSLSEANFSRALAMLGEHKLVELVCAVGFYSMVAMTLNAFDVPVPAEKVPLE